MRIIRRYQRDKDTMIEQLFQWGSVGDKQTKTYVCYPRKGNPIGVTTLLVPTEDSHGEPITPVDMIAVGVSRCHPGDIFEKRLGRRLSFDRALQAWGILEKHDNVPFFFDCKRLFGVVPMSLLERILQQGGFVGTRQFHRNGGQHGTKGT